MSFITNSTWNITRIARNSSEFLQLIRTNLQYFVFREYEIIAGPYAMDPNYRFYFMFLLRNTLDRILPFLVLLTMNVLIVKALKEDERLKLQKEPVVSKGKTVNLKSHRRNVKDATRALISLVSIYLLSQSLQVFFGIFERKETKKYIFRSF